MKLSRRRFAAALTVAAAGAAAAVVIGSLAGGARPSAPAALAVTAQRTAAGPPVFVNCRGRDQVQPSSFVLICGDGGGQHTGMRWRAWRSSAYGTGTARTDDCVPDCAQGRLFDLPALVVLWRPEPLPHQPGVRYFTRLTGIYPGRHCVPGFGGKPNCLPVTGTQDLGSSRP